jgi:molecular chaperone DnaK
MAADNMTLGHFRLEGIPSAPRGIPQVEVRFDIDANGILNVTATDKASGKAQQITVTASTNLSSDQVERLVNEARSHQAEDERRHQLASARNEADTLVYQAEKALKDLGDQVPASDRTTIENQIKAVKTAVAGDNSESIRSAARDLQNATYALSQQAQASSSAGYGGSTGPNPSGDEEVVEGEFTEA